MEEWKQIKENKFITYVTYDTKKKINNKKNVNEKKIVYDKKKYEYKIQQVTNLLTPTILNLKRQKVLIALIDECDIKDSLSECSDNEYIEDYKIINEENIQDECNIIDIAESK